MNCRHVNHFTLRAKYPPHYLRRLLVPLSLKYGSQPRTKTKMLKQKRIQKSGKTRLICVWFYLFCICGTWEYDFFDLALNFSIQATICICICLNLRIRLLAESQPRPQLFPLHLSHSYTFTLSLFAESRFWPQPLPLHLLSSCRLLLPPPQHEQDDNWRTKVLLSHILSIFWFLIFHLCLWIIAANSPTSSFPFLSRSNLYFAKKSNIPILEV